MLVKIAKLNYYEYPTPQKLHPQIIATLSYLAIQVMYSLTIEGLFCYSKYTIKGYKLSLPHFSPNDALHPVNTMATRAIQKLGAYATPISPD